MIDRGDLSVETIRNYCYLSEADNKYWNKYSKPVIVATEMLHSMINNPFPTKAEVTDISNCNRWLFSNYVVWRNSCWRIS